MSRTFHNLISKLRDWRPSISKKSYESLGSDNLRNLEVPLVEEEVLVALSTLCEDKAPRPKTLRGVAQLVRPWVCSPMVTSSSPLRTTGGLPGH